MIFFAFEGTLIVINQLVQIKEIFVVEKESFRLKSYQLVFDFHLIRNVGKDQKQRLFFYKREKVRNSLGGFLFLLHGLRNDRVDWLV